MKFSWGLLLAAALCAFPRASLGAAHLDIMVTREIFPSGFQRTDECEDRLDPLMRHSFDEFDTLALGEKIQTLHRIADRIFHRALDFMTDPGKPVPSFLKRRHALRAAVMRLNSVADVETNELGPYAQELLVIANKMGSLAAFTLRLPADLALGLDRFTRIVAELPADDVPLNHALRAVAYGNLAVYLAKDLHHPETREYAIKGVAHYLASGIHEDANGFKQGLITGSVYLVFIQLFDAAAKMSPEQRASVEPHAILWLRAMRAMLNVMLGRGGATGDYQQFKFAQRQLEHLNMHPQSAGFPALKEEFFRAIAEFRPTERNLH